MRLRAYTVPTKRGHLFYMPEEPLVTTKDVTRLYAPEDPFIITKAMGRCYLHEKRRTERFQVELITPKILEETDELTNMIEGGLLDTLYRDEKLLKESISRLNQWYVGVHLKHWFYRYFLGPILVLGSLGRIAEIAAGLQLIFGRSWFVGRLEGIYKKFFQGIAKGIEASYKDVEAVIQREDERLKTLQRIIDSSPDRTEAYTRAFHACDELGLPYLKDFYIKSIPLGEWSLQEPNIYFPLTETKINLKKKGRQQRHRRGRRPPLQGDLFTYDIRSKELQGIQRYSDLEKLMRKAAVKGGFTEIPVYKTDSGKTIWAFELGSDTDEVILIKAGTHGNEDASPRAALQMIRSLSGEGGFTGEVLGRARLIIMPCDDPDGFDIRNKMFVDMMGHEEHSPVQRGMVRYRDANGVWGDSARSHRILGMQDYIRRLKPTFAIDLHETVIGMAEYWAQGAGILSIEDFHVPLALRARIETMKAKPDNRLAHLLTKIPLRRHLLAMEYARDILKENPAFELGDAMMQHVKKKGYKTFTMEYQKLMTPPLPIFPPQILFFDEGRAIDGPLLYEGDIRVCTAWLHDEFGTTAFTSETFPNPMDERVLEDLAYVEGGIMKRLEIGEYAG